MLLSGLDEATHVSHEQINLVKQANKMVLSSRCPVCFNPNVKKRYLICCGGGCFSCEECAHKESIIKSTKGRNADPNQCGVCKEEKLLSKFLPLKCLDALNSNMMEHATESITVAIQDSAANKAKEMETESKIRTFRQEAVEKTRQNQALRTEIEELRKAVERNRKRPRAEGDEEEEEAAAEREAKKKAYAEKKASLALVPHLKAMLRATRGFLSERDLVAEWEECMADVEEDVKATAEAEAEAKKARAQAKRRATIAAKAEAAAEASAEASD